MIERPDKLNNEAIILAAKGNYSDAIACFKRAIIIDKKNSLLWYNLGVTYRDDGKLNEAKNALKEAFSIEPENTDITEAYVTTLLNLNLIPEAAKATSFAMSRQGPNANLWNLYGVTLFRSEDYKNAAECFEKAVSINPYYLDALYNLRDCYQEIKNSAGAAECNKRIKELE